MIKRIYHFLGGVYVAILLIACTTLFVITGTFLESWTGSHLYASQFTYGSPLFALLLWGFFVNILISALRRWPFKQRHIPFLITHLGLLLVILGVQGKHYFGLQGTMSLKEGTASHMVAEQNSYALQLIRRDQPPIRLPLKKGVLGTTEEGIKVSLLDLWPHSSEKLTAWIIKDVGIIKGLKPIPIDHSALVRFFPEPAQPWILNAYRDKSKADIYSEQTHLQIYGKELIEEISLKEALKTSIPLPLGTLNVTLDDHLHCHITGEMPCNIMIPLSGKQALMNINETRGYLGDYPLRFEIAATPSLNLIRENDGLVTLMAINEKGQVWVRPFDKIESLISYDDGYGGYATRFELPASFLHNSSRISEELALEPLKEQLGRAQKENIELSPPLQMLRKACDKENLEFVPICIEYLSTWKSNYGWLFDPETPLSPELTTVLQNIEWDSSYQGALWAAQVIQRIEDGMRRGNTASDLLKKERWPLVAETSDEAELLTIVTRQIFAAAATASASGSAAHNEQKGVPSGEAKENAVLLSALMRAYELHLYGMTPEVSDEEIAARFKDKLSIELESPVIPMLTKQTPLKKLEDNIPAAVIRLEKGLKQEVVGLGYQPMGRGLKWAVWDGEYLAQFVPMYREIPYRVRLRTARQRNYLQSTQAYSYESDLIVMDRRTEEEVEVTVSMNRVYETKDGYRFYLSTIATGEEGSAKQIQLVVNYDPVKYLLTYPGAIVMCCGIILLLWSRRN